MHRTSTTAPNGNNTLYLRHYYEGKSCSGRMKILTKQYGNALFKELS
jgi:hypothetical protein